MVLTQGKFALVDEDDYDIVNSRNWWITNNRRAEMRTFYATGHAFDVENPKKSVLMHRFLWGLWEVGPIPELDHINHNGLDNRRQNLRPATGSENHGNIPTYRTNRSGYKGVAANKQGGWYVRLQKDGIVTCLGTFDSKEDAARSYDRYAIRPDIFGQFACTNFPRSDYEDK